MTYFESVSLLTLDNQAISLQQALGYLQLSGKLQPLLREIVVQHVVYQEIQGRDDLQVSPSDVEQAILDFRLQRQLADTEQFQQWLGKQRINYDTFRTQVAYELKLQKLRVAIAASNLQTYFEENRTLLEQFDLSCLVTADPTTAQELKVRCQEKGSDFEQLARDHNQKAETRVKFSRSLVRRGGLPAEIKTPVETASTGVTLGPLLLAGPAVQEQRWGLFRIEQILPAVLDEQLKSQLENRLFIEWLAKKINPLKIEFASKQTDLKASPEELASMPEGFTVVQKNRVTKVKQALDGDELTDLLLGQ